MKRVYMLILILTALTFIVSGQELPLGKYSTENSKCFGLSGNYLTIGKDYSFSYSSYSCSYRLRGVGKYEITEGEYIFTFSPKDTVIFTPSLFQESNDLNSSVNDLKIRVENSEKEPLIGAYVCFLDEKSEIINKVVTDIDGHVILRKGIKDRLNLISISYAGFDGLEIPIEKINGNLITVRLVEGKPFFPGNEIFDIQLQVKKIDLGILIKWQNHEEFHKWFHENKWKDDDCY